MLKHLAGEAHALSVGELAARLDLADHDRDRARAVRAGHTFSMCAVWGNMSTGHASVHEYMPESLDMSVAWVSGLQLT